MDLDPSLDEREQLEELEPYELAYLRKLCALLKHYPLPPAALDRDFERFDPAELGIDPEEDLEAWN